MLDSIRPKYVRISTSPNWTPHDAVTENSECPLWFVYKSNLHLAPLLGEAFMLREALLNGTHDSIEAMSNALQRGKGYINARIRLTYLSPQLIKKILNGEVPASLSATRLLEATKDLPVKWAKQTRFLEALAR